ncbi:MAG: hypothetical protein MUO72_20320 [Bacteroidales bacterium]|nr:hypothetical protein [Bacteroidales bacterium]
MKEFYENSTFPKMKRISFLKKSFLALSAIAFPMSCKKDDLPIPVYQSSAIENDTPSVLEMTYDLTLANIVPPSSAFTVTVNSVARGVSNVVISGTMVLLTLSKPVVYGDIVTVAYTKPSTNPLQTAEGGRVSSMSIQNVTNNVNSPASVLTKVFLVKNGTVQQNVSKLLELIGGISKYINPTDIVVLKCNGQWPNQGYTNTECIKYIINAILEIPGFSGEVLICDNIQNFGHSTRNGFLASLEDRRNNWADHNWSTLAAEYQGNNSPVAIFRWQSASAESQITSPSEGTGWVCEFFSFHGITAYLSYPIFESPLTSGRLIDMKNGVWEAGAYTGRRIKTIFMPTLNNHGVGTEDYAGITSAVKCFFGATEIHLGGNVTITHEGQTCYDIHSATYSRKKASYAGELAARYIQTIYSPVLYITCAIWSGHISRTGAAMETKTILACDNPATLDYVSCKQVISPYASWLNPDNDNNTRNQILGCINAGIGTIDYDKYEIISYDFG